MWVGVIVGSGGFSAQFIKIISHCGKICFNIDVLRRTACLVVGPITVGNFAFLFNCTPVGQASGSVVVPTWGLVCWWGWGPGALAVCPAHRGLPVGFLLLRCSVLFTVESLSLLCLLVVSWFVCFRDDALIS